MSPASPCQVSLLTAPGRGAIATLQLSGTGALALVESLFQPLGRRPLSQRPLGAIVLGRWQADGETREELIVCRPDETRIEIHCHGGTFAAQRIVASLVAAGCHAVPWQEVARGESRAVEAEAQIELAAARTRRTAAVLLDQWRGALRRELQAIEAALPVRRDAARQQLHDLLARAPVGLHLTQPWKVVLTGAPNVGKSSLINALLGFQRAIVFDQPGTTRDVLVTCTAVDGWPVELADTAGIHAAQQAIDRAGVQRAREQLLTADLVVQVVDLSISSSSTQGDAEWSTNSATLSVGNKCDLAPGTGAANVDLCCSALTGQGVDQLLDAIARRLVPHPPLPGAAVPFTGHQVLALKNVQQLLNQHDIQAAANALNDLLK